MDNFRFNYQLLIKNFKVIWNQKAQVLVGILFPIILSLVLYHERLQSTNIIKEGLDEENNWALTPVTWRKPAAYQTPYSITYFPDCPLMRRAHPYVLKWYVEQVFSRYKWIYGKPILDHKKTLKEIHNQIHYKPRVPAAIQLGEMFRGVSKLPKNADIYVRPPAEPIVARFDPFIYNTTWQTHLTYATVPNSMVPRQQSDGSNPTPGNWFNSAPDYFTEVSPYVNWLLYGIAEENRRSTEEVYDGQIKRLSRIACCWDQFVEVLSDYIPYIISASFLFPYLLIVYCITIEKETRSKQFLKMLGIRNFFQWMNWFIVFYPLTLLVPVILVYIFKIPTANQNLAILQYSDSKIVFLVLCTFCLAMVTLSFMIASFCTNAYVAVVVAALLWFIMFLLYALTNNGFIEMSVKEKLVLFLFPNTALSYTFFMISRFEGQVRGLQQDLLFEPYNPDMNVSVGFILLVLLFDAILFLIITIVKEYFSQDLYADDHKWFHIFSKKNLQQIIRSKRKRAGANKSAFEYNVKDKKIIVKTKELRKVFGQKIAVSKLSMNMYENEITVLLGHIGAGKTTTLLMLNGILTPTNGTALIDNNNIIQSKKYIGFCPEFNYVFNELTAYENIVFFNNLKKRKLTNLNIKKFIEMLKLTSICNTRVKFLSDKYKRLLCILIAFCGDPRVVFLDDLTIGMDSTTKNMVWNFLRFAKLGRSILVTTNCSDEAEKIGDSIAMLNNGNLIAFGSTFFLKGFGSGYNLICIKDNCAKTNKITNFLRQQIHDIELRKEIGPMLTYVIPIKHKNKYGEILLKLEENLTNLKLKSYSISDISIDSVYNTVSIRQFDKQPISNTIGRVAGCSHDELAWIRNMNYSKNETKIWPQIQAMFQKKLIYLKSKKFELIILLFTSILTFLLLYWAARKIIPIDQKPLKLDYDLYPNTISLLKKGKCTGFKAKIKEEWIKYANSFKSHKIIEVDDVMTYFKEEQKKNWFEAYTKIIDGFDFCSWWNTYVIFYNGELLHNSGVAVAAFDNALIRASFNSEYTVNIYNYPLPRAADEIMGRDLRYRFDMLIAVIWSLCFAFISSYFAILITKERIFKFKLMQLINGVHPTVYWITHFIIDFLTYLVIALIFILIISFLREEGFSNSYELATIFPILFFYGLASIPISYLWGLYANSTSIGFILSVIFNIGSGLSVYLIITNISNLNIIDSRENYDDRALFFPNYFLTFNLVKAIYNLKLRRSCERWCEDLDRPVNINRNECNIALACEKFRKECCGIPKYYFFDDPGVCQTLSKPIFVCFSILFILIAAENFYGARILRSIAHNIYPSSLKRRYERFSGLDDDVIAEKEKVANMTPKLVRITNLTVNHVSKYSPRMEKLKEITFALNRYECFGLGGSGSYNILNMLIGTALVPEGEAFINGYSVTRNINEVYQRIAYCPPFDAYLNDFTGKEIIEFYSKLKGIPRGEMVNLFTILCDNFNIRNVLSNQILENSHSSKRVFNIALSCIGNPVVTYLNNPFYGIEPNEKSNLLKTLSHIRESGKTLVLLSKDAKDYEALCTRSAFIVDGEIKCLGLLQKIKTKYLERVVITIKLQIGHQKQKAQEIINLITDNFKTSKLKEQNASFMQFSVPINNTAELAKIFQTLEANKQPLCISKYSVTSIKLDEILEVIKDVEREQNERYDLMCT